MTSATLAFLGTTELIIILVIVVLVFGLGKLPEVGKQLGAGIKNFKKEVDEASQPGALPHEEAEQTPVARDVTHEERST